MLSRIVGDVGAMLGLKIDKKGLNELWGNCGEMWEKCKAIPTFSAGKNFCSNVGETTLDSVVGQCHRALASLFTEHQVQPNCSLPQIETFCLTTRSLSLTKTVLFFDHPSLFL